jgi:hypothetical protein
LSLLAKPKIAEINILYFWSFFKINLLISLHQFVLFSSNINRASDNQIDDTTCLFIVNRKKMISPTCNKGIKHYKQASLHQLQNETYRDFYSLLCASVGYAIAEKSIEKNISKGRR